jgi:hypothetical protein
VTPRILYVSGSGRSGSTLLERLMHASGRVFATGELHVLWRLPQAAITCACGAKLPDCPTWRAILAEAGIGSAELAELARLEARVARTGFARRHGFDPARIAADPEAARFLALQRRIFAAAAAVSGRAAVADSSKAGPRALLIAALDEAAILHLRRDPGDVIASWRSRKFDRGLGADMQRLSPAAAARDWMKPEFFARRIAARRPVAFLGYEALCTDPRGTAAALAGRLGLDLGGIAWEGPARFRPGGNYHSLNGNPDRFAAGPVELAPRPVDRAALPLADRLAAGLLGAAARAAFPAPAAQAAIPASPGEVSP